MTKTDPFAQFMMPLGLTEGISIPLPGTPVVFTVILPGTMNEDFNMDLMAVINKEPDEDGKVRIDAVLYQRARKKLFFKQCILDVEGLPENMTIKQFFGKYLLAAQHVYKVATELAEKADTEANDALGKLENMQNGKSSGADGANSTTKLSNKASTSERAVPN